MEMPQSHSRPKQIDYKNQLQVNKFCDKVMDTIREWWKQTDPSNDDGMVPEKNNEDQVLIYAENDKPWRYNKGKGPEIMYPDEPNSQTDTLWAMSDAVG